MTTISAELGWRDRPAGIEADFEARDDIKIADVAPIIIRSSAIPDQVELVHWRWSWPGPTDKPVCSIKSKNRRLDEERCLIVADGSYEFTNPEPVAGGLDTRDNLE